MSSSTPWPACFRNFEAESVRFYQRSKSREWNANQNIQIVQTVATETLCQPLPRLQLARRYVNFVSTIWFVFQLYNTE